MVGNITNAKLLNGWNLILKSAEQLPQGLASAFFTLYGEKLGATYVPVYYVGTQIVNGVNHKLIAECTKLVSGGKKVKDFVIVTINIPPNSIGGKGAKVVSEENATDFVLRDDIEAGFKKAMADFVGAKHTPILEIGEQVVKGINYHFICQSQAVYPDAEPFLTRVVVNNFQDYWTIVEIEKI